PSDVPALHITELQIGREIVHRGAGRSSEGIRRRGSDTRLHRKIGQAEEDAAGRAEVGWGIVRVNRGAERDSLVGTPYADEQVLAFAHGRDRIARAEYRRAFVLTEDDAQNAIHLRGLPAEADRRRPLSGNRVGRAVDLLEHRRAAGQRARLEEIAHAGNAVEPLEADARVRVVQVFKGALLFVAQPGSDGRVGLRAPRGLPVSPVFLHAIRIIWRHGAV